MDTYHCSTSYQYKNVDGESGSKKICVTAGDSVSFGITQAHTWGGFNSVVSFNFDSKWYIMRGPCYRYDGCTYIPSSDTLITKQYLVNGIVRSLVIYKNFSQRLTRVLDGSTISYNFDSADPDYVFKGDDGYAWPIGGIAASGDGEWLGIEIRQRGIGLLNLKTLEMRRVSTLAFVYWQGNDPVTEMAVSDAGKQIVVAGENAGITLIEVGAGCGDEITDVKLYNVTPIANPCKISDIYPYDIVHRFNEAYGPRISRDGGELNFYASSFDYKLYEVTLRAKGYGGQRVDYLALGDSYSSGEGETDDKYYLSGTNENYEKCHLSNRSYPFLIAKASNIDSKYTKSVACSGATTSDVILETMNYMGQGGRLGTGALNVPGVDSVVAKTYARINFIPGRIPQGEFVGFYKPRVITIGIGGNDAKLMDKLAACVMPGTCKWASDSKKKEQTAGEIKAVYDKLVSTYEKLHADSPGARIYAIGYPKVINHEDDCNIIIDKFLNKTERKFMNESVRYLNNVVESAAKTVGIEYIDVYDSFGDKAICGSKSPSVVNIGRSGDEISLIGDSDWFKHIGSESFHPKPSGNKLVADSIIKKVGNILSYQYCTDDEVICPDQTVSAPDPDDLSYWFPEGRHYYAVQKAANFVSDCDKPCDASYKQLKFNPLSLMPNSTVRVEIQSTPQDLGKFITNGDGSLDVDVKLPYGLSEGIHTVWLYGDNYSGEPIELYQIIRYVKNGENTEHGDTASVGSKQNYKIKKREFYVENRQLASKADNSVAGYYSITSPSASEVKGAVSVADAPIIENTKLLSKNGQLWLWLIILGGLSLVGLLVYLIKFKLSK
jgi:lysophospholipase L1-like esterase